MMYKSKELMSLSATKQKEPMISYKLKTIVSKHSMNLNLLINRHLIRTRKSVKMNLTQIKQLIKRYLMIQKVQELELSKLLSQNVARMKKLVRKMNPNEYLMKLKGLKQKINVNKRCKNLKISLIK